MHFNNAFTFCWSLQIRALCLIAWSSVSGLFWAVSVHLQSRNVLWMISSKAVLSSALLQPLSCGSAWLCLVAFARAVSVPPSCRTSQLNNSSADSAHRQFGIWALHATAPLYLCWEGESCPQFFGSCIVIIYITVQCLSGMGRVQGFFTLSNHEDYSWSSLVPTAPRVLVLHPRFARGCCCCCWHIS